MVEAFLELGTNAKLMLTSRNNIILFDTLEYNTCFLDKLYKVLSEIGTDSITVVVHAIYDKEPYNNVYKTETYQVADKIYTGVISQLDINKLMCVFNAAKINNIRICDKMVMYDHFLKTNQCLVESINGTNIIVSKGLSGISSITYAKNNSLEQSLLQTCRRTGVRDIINFNTFIDYDSVKWFENFVKVQDLSIFVTLTTFGFFKFINTITSVDIEQVKFNSKLETVTYATKTKKSDKVLRSSIYNENVNNIIVNEPDTEISVDDKKEIKKPERLKNAQQIPNKSGKVLLTCIISLIGVSLLAAFIISYYFDNKAKYPESLTNQNNNMIKHLELQQDKLNETPIHNNAVILDNLLSRCPLDVNIGSVIIDDSIEVVYYVAETGDVETVKNSLSDIYKINGVSESGVVTLNDVTYTKYTISLSVK